MNRRRFLLSGLALSAGALSASPAWAQSPVLTIGQSVDLTGPGQSLGRDYFTGAKLCLDRANRDGGVAGRSLRLTQLDDGGNPQRAVANTQKLLGEERADLLFGYTNDACIAASLGSPAFVNASRIMFAPMTGAQPARPDARVLYLRSTYGDEIAALLGTFHGAGLRRFAIAHDGSETARSAREAAASLLKSRGFPDPALVALGNAPNGAPRGAESLIRTEPQAVVILADTIPTALLARELRQRAPGIFVCATSNVDQGTLRELVGAELAAGIVVSRVVPDPLRDPSPVVREFNRAFQAAFDEQPSAATLEGYLAARALLQALRRSNGASDPERLASAANALSPRDLGDLNRNLSNGSRGLRYVDTAVITRSGTVAG